MKRIKPDELTAVLTEDIIVILAAMIDEVPQSKEWHEIFDVLPMEDYLKVEDRRSQLQRKNENNRVQLMTEEERIVEEKKWQGIRDNLDPQKFYGNMGQPETVAEFKNRKLNQAK
jgi:hypothetical protein